MTDDKNQFKEFCKEIQKDGNLRSELITIQVRMQEMAEMRQPMPKTKCREITPEKDPVREYELKTKHLRVYLIHEENTGRIIVLAGKKGTQKKDIRKFRNLKEAYLTKQS